MILDAIYPTIVSSYDLTLGEPPWHRVRLMGPDLQVQGKLDAFMSAGIRALVGAILEGICPTCGGSMESCRLMPSRANCGFEERVPEDWGECFPCALFARAVSQGPAIHALLISEEYAHQLRWRRWEEGHPVYLSDEAP